MRTYQITKYLLIISIVASILIIIKGGIFSKTSIIYLIWNLFLAWIPYIISSYLVSKDTTTNIFVPLFIIWLIFFPNTVYIVTDMVHITLSQKNMLWYDSLIFFFFAWIGLLLGMISLFQIHEYINDHLKQKNSELIIVGVCILSSLGIYLGRFKRLNSWDIFIHPIRILFNFNKIFTDKIAPVFIIVFTAFTYSTYKTVSVLLKKDNNVR